jgi:hypothetical protein
MTTRLSPSGAIIRWSPDPPEVVLMCYDRWMRREKRREEQFDQELRYLLDEDEERRPAAAPIVEHERDTEPADPDRPRVETVASL